MRDDTYKLYTGWRGQPRDLPQRPDRDYNDTVKQYLDTAVRHRRSMLALNTAVGLRVLP